MTLNEYLSKPRLNVYDMFAIIMGLVILEVGDGSVGSWLLVAVWCIFFTGGITEPITKRYWQVMRRGD